MSAWVAVFCAAIVVVSFLGGALPLATVLTHTRLQIYLSFAAGSMLGAVFFHMLPEAVHLGTATALPWVAVGLLSLFFLERFFAFHHHEAPLDAGDTCVDIPRSQSHDHDPHEHPATPVVSSPTGTSPNTKTGSLHWGAAAFGLAAHTLAGGVALASALAADESRFQTIGPTTWGVFLATLLHKPADALTIVSLMLRAGVPRSAAHLVNLGFSLMLPVGVLLFFAGSQWLQGDASMRLTANTLAFSAGTFLCIALSDLLPELQFHSHDRVKLSLALLLGFGLMGGSSLWGNDHHHDPLPGPAAAHSDP